MFPITPPLLARKILKLAPEEVPAVGSLSPIVPPAIPDDAGHDTISVVTTTTTTDPLVPSISEARLEDNGSPGSAAEEASSPTDNSKPPVVLTTGLLSLGIHEELTFNGTEIALHPDLFASHSPLHHHQQQICHPTCISSTPTSVRLPTTTLESSTIMPGDLVEIRVWDAIPDIPSTSTEFADVNVSLAQPILAQPRLTFADNDSAQNPYVDTTTTNNYYYAPEPTSSTTNSSVSSSLPANPPGQTGADEIVSDGHQHLLHPEEASLVSEAACTTTTAAPTDTAAHTAENTSGTPPYLYRTLSELPDGHSILMEFPSSMVLSSSLSTLSIPLITTTTLPILDTAASTTSNHKHTNSTGSAASNLTSLQHHPDGINHHPYQTHSNKKLYKLRTSFIIKVGKHFALKENSRTQISLLRQVADLYQLSSFDTVTATKVHKLHHQEVLRHTSTDFIMVTIKDQFISRGEMFHYLNSILGKWVFCGERLTSQEGVRAIAKEIRHADKIIKSGIITKETKITFRSRSARIIWVVQISTEMWDYTSPYESNPTESKCQIYFHKFVQFMHRLFEKWRKLEVTHSLTVLFFSRSYVLLRKEANINPQLSSSFPDSSTVQRDSDGRLYQDHYKVVVENETRPDWESLVLKIKKAFVEYPQQVGWGMSSETESRIPSTAAQGNLLEAINVTLNVLSLHYIDRDLHRTGNSIVVISAGNGVFEVGKKMAGITKQRMMDNGIGSDMLCLGLPPLHVAPFFLYKESAAVNTNREETWFDNLKTYFEIPHWMNLSFVDYGTDEDSLVHLAPDAPDATISVNHIASAISEGTGAPTPKVTTISSRTSPRKIGEMSQQRDLISCRDFKDILEACRPRYRNYDTMEGLPSALRALLHKTSLMQSSGLVIVKRGTGISEEVRAFKKNEEKSFLSEWGAVDFGSIRGKWSKDVTASGKESCDEASAGLKTSNLWNENLSQVHLPRIPHQASFALPMSGEMNILSGPGIQHGKSKSIAKLKLMMESYDANVTSKPISTTRRFSIENIPPQKSGTFSPDKSQKHGIGAALNRFSAANPPGKYQTTAIPKAWSSKNIQATSRYGQIMGPSSMSCSLGTVKYPIRQMPVAFEPLDDADRSYEVNPDSEVSKSLADEEFLIALGGSQTSQVASETIGPFLGSPSSLLSLSRHGIKNKKPSLRQRHSKQFLRRYPSQDSEKSSTFGYQKQDGLRNPYRFRSRRKPWVLNPFRQQDEDEMLSKRTHNRRRWSHVFPPGEAEFKRHSGPLWNSLSQPAVLPLSTDYLPEEYELNDPEKFEFNHYNIFIDAMDTSYYNSYSELLSEMVIQRIIQDYQIVSQDVLDERYQRTEFKKKSAAAKRSGPPLKSFNLRSALMAQSNESSVQHILSMGHNVVYLRYNKNADVIEVVQYHAKFANDDSSNTYTYRYLLWMPLSTDFQPVAAIFKKFGSFYRWNRLDNLICGDPAKVGLSEDFKFRRIGFGIIPDRFDDLGKEFDYVQKFLRLLDYLKKLVPQVDSPEMDIKIVSASNRQQHALVSRYIKTADRVKRFIVQLRKGTRDKYEWLELVLDATFDTQQAFRIDVNWLVASCSKVEAQIQLLLRRCMQYGLRIVQLPNYANSSNLYLHPFIAPSVLAYESSEKGKILEEQLNVRFQFAYDGKRWVDPVEIPAAPGFYFPIIRGKRSRVVGRQYIHRSGIAFIRAFEDEKGRTIFLWLQNRFLTGNSEEMIAAASSLLKDLKSHIKQSTTDNDNHFGPETSHDEPQAAILNVTEGA